MAIALPQCLESTKDVTVVTPDGRYVPAEIPSRNMDIRMAKRLLLKEINERAAPTAIAEKMMVFLWVIREDMYPDPNIDMKYPMERNRKREPALPWLNPKSFSMLGSNGAEMSRDVKFNKKMEVTSKSGES
jgi:hypothetical protein